MHLRDWLRQKSLMPLSPLDNIIKLIVFVTDEKKAKVLVPSKPFQSDLILVGKTNHAILFSLIRPSHHLVGPPF